jgi:hypothetical protein
VVQSGDRVCARLRGSFGNDDSLRGKEEDGCEGQLHFWMLTVTCLPVCVGFSKQYLHSSNEVTHDPWGEIEFTNEGLELPAFIAACPKGSLSGNYEVSDPWMNAHFRRR